MRIADIYARRTRPILSFEVFPAKTQPGMINLHETLRKLALLKPDFMSVTFRSDRSSRDTTFALARHIQHELGIPSTGHITCVGASESVLLNDLALARDMGLENMMALRGDIPADGTRPEDGACRYANELVTLIKRHFDFCIGVGSYPETHPDCPSPEQDLENLKRKIDAGAEFTITQLLLDNRHFYEFHERALKAGITVPIVPALMPILSGPQIQRVAALSKMQVPVELQRELDRLGDDEAAVRQMSVEYAVKQSIGLLEYGVPGIHYYCLNRMEMVSAILEQLGPHRPRLPTRA